MPKKISDLGSISDAIRESYEQQKSEQEKWFEKHKPIKEFSVEREGELVYYGVWDFGDGDLIVMFKYPNGNYAFRNRLLYDKKLIKELWTLCLGE